MATRSMRIPRVFPTLAYSLYSLHDTKKGIEKKIPADPNSRYIIQKFNLTLLLDRQPRREYINIRRNTHGEFHCLLLLRYFVYCRQLNHIKVSEAQLRKKAFYNIRKFFFRCNENDWKILLPIISFIDYRYRHSARTTARNIKGGIGVSLLGYWSWEPPHGDSCILLFLSNYFHCLYLFLSFIRFLYRKRKDCKLNLLGLLYNWLGPFMS